MPAPDPVQSDEALPRKTSVVVIGGGIIGTSTALELAERGIDVVLCEKGEIACEQSSRNWGWCRQMGRDIREIPLILEAMKLWRGMDDYRSEPGRRASRRTGLPGRPPVPVLADRLLLIDSGEASRRS